MKKEYPSLNEMRLQFGENKSMPDVFEEVILKALSHFPELAATHIDFVETKKSTVPYQTIPDVSGVFKEQQKRHYTVNLLDEADPPLREALFKNLPEEAQRAVIAHELAHVLQYSQLNAAALAALMLLPTSSIKRREIVRDADLSVIKHGLGFELYVHVVYISRIPGYFQKYKNLETDYLKPQEIMDTLAVDTPPNSAAGTS